MSENDSTPSDSLRPRTKKDRSPNYPSLTFPDAAEKAETLWRAEKRHPMSLDIAADHLGYSNGKNGAFQSTISALRKYGLVESERGDVRVTDEANQLFIYPEGTPERVAIQRKLAMRPPLFGEVLKKFSDGLPSDANLRAKLQVESGFASPEAAETFIRALRSALELTGTDVTLGSGQSSSDTKELDPPIVSLDPPSQPEPPSSHMTSRGTTQGRPQSPVSPVGTGETPVERHSWKLGEGVWADVTITGTLTARSFEKLIRYVQLIDVSGETE
jgi:hypothetical protein